MVDKDTNCDDPAKFPDKYSCVNIKTSLRVIDAISRVFNMALFYALLIHVAVSSEEIVAIAFLVKKQRNKDVDQIYYDLNNNGANVFGEGTIGFRHQEMKNRIIFRYIYVLLTILNFIYCSLLIVFYRFTDIWNDHFSITYMYVSFAAIVLVWALLTISYGYLLVWLACITPKLHLEMFKE